jgi:Sec-independent protein translocase protein TatA
MQRVIRVTAGLWLLIVILLVALLVVGRQADRVSVKAQTLLGPVHD